MTVGEAFNIYRHALWKWADKLTQLNHREKYADNSPRGDVYADAAEKLATAIEADWFAQGRPWETYEPSAKLLRLMYKPQIAGRFEPSFLVFSYGTRLGTRRQVDAWCLIHTWGTVHRWGAEGGKIG